MSLGNKAILGLLAGLGVGMALAAANRAPWLAIGAVIELFGKLWINAILMTLVPLVMAKLFVSIAGRDGGDALGRAGGRSFALFLLLLGGSAAATALVAPALFSYMPIDPAASAALRASLSASNAARDAPPGAAQWLLSLVPTNPLKAAADSAMLPLITFSVLFALAATRIKAPHRDVLILLWSAVDSTIAVLLGWIVSLSPWGVFALAVGLALQVGGSIVSALGYYIFVTSLTLVVFTLALYGVVGIGAGLSPGAFARAVAPSQIVAFSTHSSAASLPAMMEGAETALKLSKTATGFVLPLSLAVFKYSGPIWFMAVVAFVARLYDVSVAPDRLIPTILVAVATSFTVGAVPSGAAVVLAPVLLAAGLPVEALGLLLAVDPIPNAFRTVANVTAMMAVTVMAGRESATGPAAPAGERPPATNCDTPVSRPAV